MSGEACDGESGESVAEAAFEEKAAYEGGRRGGVDFERRGAATLLEHLTRGERSVARADHLVMMRGVAHAEVENVAFERLNLRVVLHLHRFVHVQTLPTS